MSLFDADADAVTPSAVTPGVTHIGGYHHPSEGNFFYKDNLTTILPPGSELFQLVGRLDWG